MEQATIDQLVERIHVLLGEKLRVSGASLAARAAKAGRRLPMSVRRAIAILVEAQSKARDPRIARLIDPTEVSDAYSKCVKYLNVIDPIEERSRNRYRIAALISFQLILVAVAAIAVLRWRGYL